MCCTPRTHRSAHASSAETRTFSRTRGGGDCLLGLSLAAEGHGPLGAARQPTGAVFEPGWSCRTLSSAVPAGRLRAAAGSAGFFQRDARSPATSHSRMWRAQVTGGEPPGRPASTRCFDVVEDATSCQATARRRSDAATNSNHPPSCFPHHPVTQSATTADPPAPLAPPIARTATARGTRPPAAQPTGNNEPGTPGLPPSTHALR